MITRDFSYSKSFGTPAQTITFSSYANYLRSSSGTISKADSVSADSFLGPRTDAPISGHKHTFGILCF